MKTKRELLKEWAEKGICENILCEDCPRKDEDCWFFRKRLSKIGAMAILRQNRKKTKR